MQTNQAERKYTETIKIF